MAVSALTWIIFGVLTRGIKQAKIMNAITTVAKLVPILAFVVLVAFLGFNIDTFTMDFWGESSGLSVMEQVQGIMLFTVWAFIGIEGASVYSKQAQTRSDVGRATVLGFTTVLLLLVTVSTLSYGVLSQEELAALQITPWPRCWRRWWALGWGANLGRIMPIHAGGVRVVADVVRGAAGHDGVRRVTAASDWGD